MHTHDPRTQQYLDAVAQYSDIITKVCYYYARDTQAYNDLRQEAMLARWQSWGKFRGESQLSTWIYRVCINACVSAWRADRHSRDNVSVDSLQNLAADQSDRPGQLRQMHELISRLNQREKAVIMLWLDNYPYDTIAEMMGVPRNTVASWLKRIKEKLVKLSNQ